VLLGTIPACLSSKAASVGDEILNAVLSVFAITAGFALAFAICGLLILLRNLWREKDKKRPLSTALFPSIALTLPLTMLLGFLLDHATSADDTRTTIAVVLSRIESYARQRGSLPQSLDGLPREETRTSKITDGWGRRLLYDINNDGTITLASLGKDGRPGGDGDNADPIATCRA
jgi:Type II secretion system (T2SS), protein G